jgi:hypothetical protein
MVKRPTKSLRGNYHFIHFILSCVEGLRVTYRRGFGLDDRIYCHFIHSPRDYSLHRYRYLHTLQFTVTHALRFSSSLVVSWQRIYKSHWNCSTHEVFFAQSNFFLTISSQSPSTAISQFPAATANSRTPLNSNASASKPISWQAVISRLNWLKSKSSQGHIATDGQSVGKSWCRAPSGAYDQIFINFTPTVLFLWDALSDERTCLSFVYAAGPCQRSLSGVRAPWDSRPYFIVSDMRLPFSSPPTTCKVTVEVFDPASTR